MSFNYFRLFHMLCTILIYNVHFFKTKNPTGNSSRGVIFLIRSNKQSREEKHRHQDSKTRSFFSGKITKPLFPLCSWCLNGEEVLCVPLCPLSLCGEKKSFLFVGLCALRDFVMKNYLVPVAEEKSCH